jgi:hypothetical protein
MSGRNLIAVKLRLQWSWWGIGVICQVPRELVVIVGPVQLVVTLMGW